MKKMKKLFTVIVSLALAISTYCTPLFAVESNESYPVQLYGEVTDAGQVISKMVIDYGETHKVRGVTTETFKVHVNGTNPEEYNVPENEISYNAKEYDRKIVKVETEGQYVTVYFDMSEGSTLTYLQTGGRNIPLDLEYTITQINPLTLTSADGRELDTNWIGNYTCDNTVKDEETSKFQSIIVDGGINYQYYDASKGDSLVVWFHGNGEGDYHSSQNNVAQMLGNRGTVAWATDEAQNIFGGADVMAFQAPDTWYYAQRDGLLEKAYNEIQEVITTKGIDPDKVYVSGCSAGGYMTTRMLIAYPDLFKAAMINCPALDVASERGGQTPTDEELASLKNSDTAIWLVQGETDSSVATDECSKRMFSILTEGRTDIVTSNHSQSIASDFTTYETSDNKYKLSLYETTDDDKLMFAEDYDQDGVETLVEYSNHWSWIYTLNNNPQDSDGTHIWQWAANYVEEEAKDIYPVELHTEVTDAGQVVSKMVIDYGSSYKVSGVTKDTFIVHAKASTEAIREGTDLTAGDYDIDRKIVKVETDGQYVTVYFDMSEGATLSYLSAGRNYPADLTYTVIQNSPITLTAADGRVIDDMYSAIYTADTSNMIDKETSKFQSVIVDGGINYQYYDAQEGDSLIVWFHGNGEGDYNNSQNNVAQMLGNRGTVAWATDEAQNIFGGADVMAFQAPDTWYYAQRDGLLEKAYNEIQEVITTKGIDPDKVYVSGCSAGGYMTTRMLIAYPDLFKAAMINCPALDVASERGGQTPTDEELASLKNSDTAIWLVQGETDSSVATDECSKRMFSILTEGRTDIVTSNHSQSIASDFTTYETSDNKYKLSLYETTDDDKLMFAEDYDQDGVETLVEYSNHWSWIYTLNNNPQDSDGTHIWQWAANYQPAQTTTKPDTPVDTNKPANSVKTGDDADLMLLGGLVALSVLGTVAVRRKYN